MTFFRTSRSCSGLRSGENRFQAETLALTWASIRPVNFNMSQSSPIRHLPTVLERFAEYHPSRRHPVFPVLLLPKQVHIGRFNYLPKHGLKLLGFHGF